MKLIAIDPGVHRCACAVFESGTLVLCGFDLRVTADVVVVERPESQGDRTRAARPKDLIDLAWSGALLAGAYAGRGAAVIEYTPHQWKGSEPKPIQHARLWRVLSVAERAALGGAGTLRAIDRACEKGALKRWGIAGADCYPRAFTLHNQLDAAALGCWHLGRLARQP